MWFLILNTCLRSQTFFAFCPRAKGDFDDTLLPVPVKGKNEVFYRFLATITAPKPSKKSVAGVGCSNLSGSIGRHLFAR
jgi:hypothetical protein